MVKFIFKINLNSIVNFGAKKIFKMQPIQIVFLAIIVIVAITLPQPKPEKRNPTAPIKAVKTEADSPVDKNPYPPPTMAMMNNTVHTFDLNETKRILDPDIRLSRKVKLRMALNATY